VTRVEVVKAHLVQLLARRAELDEERANIDSQITYQRGVLAEAEAAAARDRAASSSAS
jgi:lipoprotein NlpI